MKTVTISQLNTACEVLAEYHKEHSRDSINSESRMLSDCIKRLVPQLQDFMEKKLECFMYTRGYDTPAVNILGAFTDYVYNNIDIKPVNPKKLMGIKVMTFRDSEKGFLTYVCQVLNTDNTYVVAYDEQIQYTVYKANRIFMYDLEHKHMLLDKSRVSKQYEEGGSGND